MKSTEYLIRAIAAAAAAAALCGLSSCGAEDGAPPETAAPFTDRQLERIPAAPPPGLTEAEEETAAAPEAAPEIETPEMSTLPVDPETVPPAQETAPAPVISDPFNEDSLISYAADLAHFFPQPLQSPEYLNRGRSFAFYLLRQTYLDSLASGTAFRMDGNIVYITESGLAETAFRRLGLDFDVSSVFEWPFGEPKDGEIPYDITAEMPQVGIDGASASVDGNVGAASVALSLYDLAADSPEHNRLIYRFTLASGVWRLTEIDEG